MTSSPPSSFPPKRLDLRVIFETPLRQFAPWLVSVLIVTWAGYPGVVCITPVAWVIALRVGIMCVTRSISEESSRRLLEAALAGALFGLLQGILFMVIVPFMGPIKPSEEANAILLTLILIVGGIFAGAGLSLFTAFLTEGRRNRAIS